MKISIGTKTVRQNIIAEVEPCPCCGSKDVHAGSQYTGNGCDRFTGYGYVTCNSCGHNVTRESHNIGWGDTEEGLARSAIATWNSQYHSSGKQGLNEEIERLKKENTRLKEENANLREMMTNCRSCFDIPFSEHFGRSLFQ